MTFQERIRLYEGYPPDWNLYLPKLNFVYKWRQRNYLPLAMRSGDYKPVKEYEGLTADELMWHMKCIENKYNLTIFS